MKFKTFSKLIFFLMFNSINFLSLNANDEEIFSLANNFYKTENYESAIKSYLDIKEKNFQVFYNLGNSFYRIGDFGKSLLYWRRAEKNWPLFLSRAELIDNIYLLTHGNKESESLVFLPKLKIYLVSILRSVPLIFLQIIFLSLWFFLFFYINYLFRNKKKLIISFLFSLIAICGTLLALRYRFDIKKYGVVLQNCQLLSGPGNIYQELGKIPLASEVIVQKESDGFYKIKTNNFVGWVNTSYVEKI